MEPFEVLLLGCGAALPAFNRMPSSQLLNCHDQLFLIDCGEGTQFQLSKYKVKKSRIHHIFISHLHGDHVFGLPGLITSYNLLGRIDPLFIYAPSGIREMMESVLSFSSYQLNFELHFVEVLNFNGQIIFENEHLQVRSLPLKHKIPACGYLFEEKFKKKQIDFEKIKAYSIPQAYWKNIEAGEDILIGSKKYTNSQFCLENKKSRSYAYCTDTQYNEALIPFLTNVDALYHETTYLDELREKAAENGHSTAREAAMIALKSKAGLLITGHYSSRYEHLEPFEAECKLVFQNVILGREGLSVQIEQTN
jgi:ribonuclease Z